MNKKTLIIVLIVAVILGIGGFFLYKAYFKPKTKETPPPSRETEVAKLDSKKEATHLSKVMDTKGAYWMRGLPFIWNDIEKEKGVFDWSSTDESLQGKDDYFSGDAYHIAMIWPYANWDQDKCRQGEKYKATGHLKESDEELKMGAPCDLSAYANFVEKLVERYDGDGKDDMPELKTPIKYWEIMNEPEMQGGSIGGAGEDLKFFVGTPQEYLEILKTSYQAIKKADPEAKVAHAGMAGMQREFQDFWDPIFKEAGNYFDIANIHTISTDERREDLYLIKFKKYLEEFGIKDKPIWVTEVQFGELMDKPKDLASFERLLTKASVFSLAKGADKLFFIENWTTWDNPDAFKPPEKDEKKEKKGPPPKLDLANNSTHEVYLNLVDKINNFDRIETIEEKYEEGRSDNDGATSQIGQYKFINGSKIVYVLWGKGTLPTEISGKVKVTDIYGKAQEMDAKEIQLSDNPIFIETI